jgi:hypothetical protein
VGGGDATPSPDLGATAADGATPTRRRPSAGQRAVAAVLLVVGVGLLAALPATLGRYEASLLRCDGSACQLETRNMVGGVERYEFDGSLIRSAWADRDTFGRGVVTWHPEFVLTEQTAWAHHLEDLAEKRSSSNAIEREVRAWLDGGRRGQLHVVGNGPGPQMALALAGFGLVAVLVGAAAWREPFEVSDAVQADEPPDAPGAR